MRAVGLEGRANQYMPASAGYHGHRGFFLGFVGSTGFPHASNGESYWLVGEAMGRAMIDLLD
jgi:hypothetical protein